MERTHKIKTVALKIVSRKFLKRKSPDKIEVNGAETCELWFRPSTEYIWFVALTRLGFTSFSLAYILCLSFSRTFADKAYSSILIVFEYSKTVSLN